jgi:hypothetical protein
LGGAYGYGSNWFIGGGALLFHRVDDQSVALSYNALAPTQTVLSTCNARPIFLPGFEVNAGRYFNCGQNAITFGYWGLFPGEQCHQVTDTASIDLGTRLRFEGIEGPWDTVYNYYENGLVHGIHRSSSYNNAEVNLLGFGLGGAARTLPCVTSCAPTQACGGGACGDASCAVGGCGDGGIGGCGFGGGGTGFGCGRGAGSFASPYGLAPAACGTRLSMTWLGGFRWFQFCDNFNYGVSTGDLYLNGSADDWYYTNNVCNNLFGFQLGNSLNYALGQRCSLYAFGKSGIYNNHARYYTRIGNHDTVATINCNNDYNGAPYLVSVSRNNAAFLGELGTGATVCLCRGLSFNVGYRFIGVSGVATAVNTIPLEMKHLGNVSHFNTTSSLFLHGLNLGMAYNF